MRHRYHLLLFAYLVSSLGNWIYRLTLPLLVLELTGSALGTAAVYAIEYGPFLLLSLPGGVFADRLERRRLLILGDTAAGAIALGLTAVVAAGVDDLRLVYLAAFLLACVEPVYHPAFQSFLPALVDAEDLPAANSWMQAGDNVVALVGPVIAGGIVTVFGYQTAVAADAVTFFVSAAAIVLIRVGDAGTERRTDRGAAVALRAMVADVREAGQHVFRDNRVLLAGSLLFTGTNLAIWLLQANFVYYLTRYRDFSPSLVGVVLAAQGVGAIAGAAAASRVLRRVPAPRAILACTAGAGITTLALIPLRDVASISAVWAVVYAFGSVNVVAWFSYRQRIVPLHLLGRVVAVTRMLAFASIPAAALLAGVLESGLRNMYVIIGAAGLVRLGVALVGSRTALNDRRPAPGAAPVGDDAAEVSRAS